MCPNAFSSDTVDTKSVHGDIFRKHSTRVLACLLPYNPSEESWTEGTTEINSYKVDADFRITTL